METSAIDDLRRSDDDLIAQAQRNPNKVAFLTIALAHERLAHDILRRQYAELQDIVDKQVATTDKQAAALEQQSAMIRDMETTIRGQSDIIRMAATKLREPGIDAPPTPADRLAH
jgi:hypothetical protein